MIYPYYDLTVNKTTMFFTTNIFHLTDLQKSLLSMRMILYIYGVLHKILILNWNEEVFAKENMRFLVLFDDLPSGNLNGDDV